MALAVPPPFLERPLAGDGQHTRAWAEYHQSVTDRLADVDTQLAAARRGVTDGSDAAAGDIGEYLEASASTIPLVSLANVTIVTLTLTPGDWDVSGWVAFTGSAGTHTGFGLGLDGIDTLLQATFPAGAIGEQFGTVVHRYNVTVNTVVTLLATAAFTGTMTGTGTIRARRMR